MVDEVRLLIYRVVLGNGKRLLDGQSMPSAFKLFSSTTSHRGVIISKYQLSDDLKTASFEMENNS
ncbi:hypothetical protein C3731_21735 [Brucella oryzae]|uniref:Uncharacterized protein n=2 Tax=Brucella oryzae TaxID=335286 RepID=A0A2S7IU16_9HYPH|nr:hypothetical protein C3731_21735 [Brucella oryzae]